ncbi:MAG TPA: CoA transferase [Acidimicrobiales bacterium]|nr:CoA transferase [Acidimicrobiales bacterium]
MTVATSAHGQAQGPLAGLRVLDLSTTPAGAQASQTLADFGAEVVQVEQPGGSPLRGQPRFPFVARGKRSIVLDLHDDEDRVLARTLAAGADVVIETWRPGVAERFGLGYEDLRAENPGLVYGSVTAWGRTGPYSGAKGYEALVMARVGALSVSGNMVTRDGPAHVSVPFCMYAASQHLLTGILAALHEREASGVGQRVDASLVRGLASLGTWNWYLRVVLGKFPDAFTPSKPLNDDGVPMTPMVFMLLIALTKDGRWIQFSQVQLHLYMAMLKALGLAHLLEDEEWKGGVWAADPSKAVPFWHKLIEATREKTLAEWQAVFETDHDVWAETMRRGSELLDHPQMQHLGAVLELDDEEVGTVRQPGPIARLEATPARIDRGAPRLDADGAALRTRPWEPKPLAAADPGTAAALDGVTVLELGTFFAAPYGGTVVRELGARVIKVEPLDGEPMRNILPFPEIGGAKSLQGKESIAVDLATEEGLAIVHELARRSDIVLQSFRAGKAERHKVDSATLRTLNPDLIYLNAPGYGIDGPCGDRPAFAPTIGAGSGLVMRNIGSSVPEHPDLTTEEIRLNSMRLSASGTTEYAQADGLSAVTVASAMTLGLLARDRTGVSQEMLTTMLTSTAHALGDDMVEYADRPPTRASDPELLGYHALYRLYEASDGWVYLAAPFAGEWDDLVAALSEDVDLAGDERFADAAARTEHDTALAEVLAATFRTKPAQHWEDHLLANDVGCVVAHDEPPEAVLQSQEFGVAHGLLVRVEHPTFGEHDRLVPLVGCSRSATIAEPGVLNGQHTDAILAELGYDAATIADLRERKIIG